MDLAKALLLVVVLFAIGCANHSSKSTPVASDGSLRVITYNIRGGMGNGDKSQPPVDAKKNLPKIADFLRAEGADIIFLQEVDVNVKRSGSIDEVALLSGDLNFAGKFAPAIDLQGGQFGVAILSRWPISDARVEKLFKPDYSNHVPKYPDYYDEQRVILLVHVETPRGKIAVLCTHLGLTNDQREKQLQRIAEIASEEAKLHPVIFGGDLNARPEELELKIINTVLNDTGGGASRLNTFPWDVPNRCIDYVYTSKDFTTTRLSVPDVLLSDHRPVVVELQRAR